MKKTLLTAVLSVLFSANAKSQIPLHWVGEQAPKHAQSVTLGIPFDQGELKQKQSLTLVADGQPVAADYWPLAYWADGSIKWAAVASVVPANSRNCEVRITPQQPTPNTQHPIPTEGTIELFYSAGGQNVMDSLLIGGRKIAGPARIVCTTQDAADADQQQTIHYQHLSSHVDTAYVEQQGTIRSCIRADYHLQGTTGQVGAGTIRYYVYRGSQEVKVVHSFTYLGDQNRDFIHALGLQIEVPMREQPYNRHVAFATANGGVWAESVQPLSGRRVLDGNPRWEIRQVAGQRIPEPDHFDEKGQELLSHWAQWNSYRLTQPNDQGFSIQKRAHHNNTWIGTVTGQHAPGYAFVGDVSGGLSVGVQDFWQSYPASLQVDSAATQTALMTVYLWSPDAPAMDLRHYDNVAHDLIASYEDVQPGMSTPYGIARTSTLYLWPQTAYPGREAITAQAASLTTDNPLLPTPEYLHQKQAFGIWSLPDYSTDQRAAVEEQLEQYLTYYIKQQQQHHWYGYWNYGDFMHQYDPARHEWKYDVGGFAWDNTELGTPSWLWYSFLRTGRADLWQLATRMTRHCSEVDVYHVGEMKGLGSRHNVSHWGCGAKEARISQAAWNRFMYYLTADERLGDLMHEVCDADQMLYTIDPMRLALPREQYPCTQPARLRVGPDWLAYAGNWMTEWERTGNAVYRKKIEAGMKSICRLPNKFFTGPGVLGFDPATGVLSWEGDPKMKHTNHLCAIMGGFEINHELMRLLPNKQWEQAWLEYCRDYYKETDNQFRISRLKAYAAWKLKDQALAAEAWADMQTYSSKMQHYRFDLNRVDGAKVPEPLDESPETTTNDCALWSLEAIFMQEVIPQ